jgi:tagaturonate reductase
MAENNKGEGISPSRPLLKERVLQFGTGILLKGLPDYFIQLANQKQAWGKIVMVKSTSSTSGKDPYPPYLLLEKGLKDGMMVENPVRMDAISREINAQTQWQDLEKLAQSPDLEVLISNTTEAGLQYTEEKIGEGTPVSFPGKILSILQKRFEAGLPGWVIIPCELVTDNGEILKSLVLKLARFNGFSTELLQWIEKKNHFCNSLVDRIVSGKADERSRQNLASKLNDLPEEIIETEPYCLWAIECPEKVRNQLGWAGIHPNWILADDIGMFRERKLRILNGTHTFIVGLAFLSGKTTVLETMQDTELSAFVKELALEEVAPATAVSPEIAQSFAKDVLDRFANPYINHLLINITLQYSMKMAMRNLASIARYEALKGQVPEKMAKGFAAYLRFSMAKSQNEKGKYLGNWKGKIYPIQDEKASVFFSHQQKKLPLSELLLLILEDQALWGDFKFSEGFKSLVINYFLKEWND